MKKHILLILPIVAASLFSCGNNAPTTSSTGSTTTSSTQEHPTTIDPTSPYVTSTTDAATAVEIIEVSEAPTKVELGVQLDPTLINLKIRLSDNTTIFRHPDYTEIDFTDKSLGDDVTCVCHYKELTKSFDLVIAESPYDVVNYSSPGSISTSYIEWSFAPATGAKFIAKTAGNTANQALALKWDTKDTQIGIGMAKSQGKITKVKLTFSANNSYKEGEKKSQIGIYGKATPFAGLKDFEALTKANTDYSVLYDGNAEEKTYEIDVSSGNFTYVAFKAIGANSSYLKEIKISYDENVKPAALESISISGKPTAEIIDTEWNFSEVIVTGNFAGGIKGDLTNGCAITSLAPIPSEIKLEHEISVTAQYAHESKSVTDTLVAEVIGPTAITAILEKPTEVAFNQPLDVSEVLLRIRLSNVTDVDRNPTSIDIDWTGKSVGDTVEVVCNYLGVSKSFEATVVAGKTTAFEVEYGTADSKFSMSLYTKDSANHCYIENNSTVDTDGYVQYLNTAAYWTDSPSKITVKANLGGGSTKTFDEGYELRVALLDVSGNIISSTEKTITNKIEEKTGKEYSLVYTNVANVAGVRIIHKKLSGYNTRIYGFSLEYIS